MSKKFYFSDKIATESNECMLPSLTISEPKKETLHHEKPQTNNKKNTMSSLVHWRTTEKNKCFRLNSDDPFQLLRAGRVNL